MKSLFYRPIKINQSPTNILFWGCTHFHHECTSWATPLWKQRGFSSLAEHDDTLIKNWNAKANENTIGFLLGDIMFGPGGDKAFLDIFQQLSFKEMYLLPGNHQAGWSRVFEKNSDNTWKIGSKTLIFTPNYIEAFVNGQSVVMSHYPILSWNGQSKGSYMLFSHVHGNLEKSEVGRSYLGSECRALEMSVEKWSSPASFEEIRTILNARSPKSFDHHNAQTNNPF